MDSSEICARLDRLADTPSIARAACEEAAAHIRAQDARIKRLADENERKDELRMISLARAEVAEAHPIAEAGDGEKLREAITFLLWQRKRGGPIADCNEAWDVLDSFAATPPQPPTDHAVHMAHCGEINGGGCKYGDADCPAIAKAAPAGQRGGLTE